MRIWLGLSAIALAGVLWYGIKGLLNDEKAYQDMRKLDHFASQLLQCRLSVLDLQRQTTELSIYNDLNASSSLIRTHLQRIETQATLVRSCLDQLPSQTLILKEKEQVDHLFGHYQQFWAQVPRTDQNDPFELPDLSNWQAQTQSPISHLTEELSTLSQTVEQRIERLYRQRREVNRRNHIMILIFASATGLVVQGLTAVTYKLVNKQSRLLKKLETLARTDALTGIANRRVWDEELSRAMERARRSRLLLTVVLLDLDHFKRFNDTYGHQTGDLLLRDFGHLLKTKLREGDLVARYGGEEFAMLLHGCRAERALEVINRLREWVPYDQTFSAGLTESDGYEAGTAAVDRADRAMYQAKEQGRNCSVVLMHEVLTPSPGYRPSSTPAIQKEKK
jgi:diguanylate cyclase (GGDEF)-like protein